MNCKNWHPEVGEEAELDSRRRLMQGAEKIRADIAHAATGLGPRGGRGHDERCDAVA